MTMRKLLFLLGLLFAAAPAVVSAQTNLQPVQYQNYTPTGACTQPNWLVVTVNVGTFQCINGAWVQLGSGTVNWASPGAIGTGTPNSGIFTSLAATGGLALGTTPPTSCSHTTGCAAFGESVTSGAPTAGVDYIRADATTHSFLQSLNGGAETPLSIGLTSFTVANLSPLFTAALGANPTTAPALAFTLSNASGNTLFGNCTGTSAAPSYCALTLAMLPTGIPNSNLATPFVQLSGDATSTSTGGATTVKGINGTLLSGLGTGLLWNTTSTGVPSIATAAQVLGSFSTNVVYASKIIGVTPGVAVVPGSSATGTVDSAGPINSTLASGNIHLMMDTGVALSTSLVVGSNTWIECTSPQYGFIMQAAANVPVIVNAHQNAPTTTSGTGGYLVSNQTDSNIRITGCTLNANSLQAVTGSGNGQGTAHTTNGSNLWIFGVQLLSVNGVVMDYDEIYDSGTYSAMFSNDSNVWLNHNYLHQIVPMVLKKNTDGFHFTGPDSNIYESENVIVSGDDALAWNPDDGNETCSTCYPTAIHFGWIQHVFADNNLIDGAAAGPLVYSSTELADDIHINNTSGTVLGNDIEIAKFTTGNGNVGSVHIHQHTSQSNGSQNPYSQPYLGYYINANYKLIDIDGPTLVNPAAAVSGWNWITHNVVTPGVLSIHNATINTTATTVTANLIQITGGAAPQIQLGGINWEDINTGAAAVLGGSVVPTSLTASNCSLPGAGRLLAGGFAPTYQNGDCFTNLYPGGATVYVNTIFNEAGSGTLLAGTVPATCTAGSGCTWALTGGQDFAYASGGGVSISVPNTTGNEDLINTGQTNETIRFNLATCTGTSTSAVCQIGVRWTNSSNFTAINILATTGAYQIYDVVSGTANLKYTSATGTGTGNYTITLSSTSITVAGPQATSPAETIANTGTDMGITMQGSTATGMKLSSMSAKSF